MRLTLALICAWFAIYCSSGRISNGHGNVVLSLPPSLIADVAALRQQQKQQQQEERQEHERELDVELTPPLRWKKDARILFDNFGGNGRDDGHWTTPLPSSLSGKASHNLLDLVQTVQGDDDDDADVAVEPQPADFNRKTLSDGMFDSEAGAKQSAPQEIASLLHFDDKPQKYGKPFKYWVQRCRAEGTADGQDCSQEYYHDALAARDTAARLSRLHRLNASQKEQQFGSSYPSSADDIAADQEAANSERYTEADYDEDINNEVLMLLHGEQDLIKFLHWAMKLLYPFQVPGGNLSESAADYYHPGMFIWKKLKLSGHLEPPLIVDEPRYVIVRREKSQDLSDDQQFEDDPFIPPRGRKHNSPDLDALLQRYETFVPNRGKRDKVKDLFKYDDLFFPNRGKKNRDFFKVDDPFFPNRGKKLKLRDIYNLDDPFFPNRGKRTHVQPPAAKLGQQLVANEINGSGGSGGAGGEELPQRMSTHKINGYDQSVKPSMSAAATLAATTTDDTGAANRLHSTRSMSTNSQQQLLLQQLRRQQEAEVQHQLKSSSSSSRSRNSIKAPKQRSIVSFSTTLPCRACNPQKPARTHTSIMSPGLLASIEP
ncbi:uncharacterized protein LOC115621876 [Scaptodrosophila lebanonensis]|uniref:Uncharacterized protein LOC115621876 n=1 Tax=Drosophila lebanonensis TaxID=7225 RepID=A0A6J2T9D8_DROLE|nr:uncharacterized protein LOC115621876 [Scaptodrosophila lebanonensis]